VTADESSNETAETAINPFPQSAASLIIPKLGIAAPIIFSQSAENKDILRDLHSGAAHYPGSALFGERGVGIVLGHSSAFPWYQGNYGSVFSLLHRLTVGDEFFVFYENKIYTYRVSKTDIVMPKNFQVENPDGGSHLVLLSCWPVGTNWRRIVVFSDLVSVK
jgi:LPXTG-site transpeptidase (sortase) family protein